ncbi:hypothetical protein EI555_010035, partial [Monodon monoceros]
MGTRASELFELAATGVSHQQGSVLLNGDVFDLLGSLIHEFLVLRHQGFGDGLADWVNLGHETTTVYADTHDHAPESLFQKQKRFRSLPCGSLFHLGYLFSYETQVLKLRSPTQQSKTGCFWELASKTWQHSSFFCRTMLLDEYQERLFVGGKDLVYSLSLEHIGSDYREICKNSSELFAGLYSDYWGRDAAIFRSLGRLAHIRTEHDDERLLKEPKFVGLYMIPDNEDRDDNKVYFFFTEKALEAENNAQAIYTRVGRLCVNDVGGQRILVNKWSTFLKARLVCSVPGMNGIDTYFDELEDVFLLYTRDHKNPVIFGLFNTTSNIFRGHAICVYHMSSIRAAFNGPYAHKEGPEYHWSLYEGKVPYPRPGSCASKVNGGRYGTTKDYPDDAIRFARSHPLMHQPIKPAHKKPILVKTDGKYNLKQIAVDRVEAEDGQYDVLFIGTDNGIVLKVITIYNQETESMEEVILEELQIFKDPVPIISMEISSKRQQLYIGSASAVAQVRFHQCDMYGSACADCCLARDPYCAWDGISCSRYYPTGTHAKRSIVKTDDRMVKMDLGLLFLRVRKVDAGTYFCQTVEHSFVHTIRKITLEVVEEERVEEMFTKDYEEDGPHKTPCPVQSSIPHGTKPWYKEFLQLIGYSNFQRVEEYCE